MSQSNQKALSRPIRSALEVETKTFKSVITDMFEALDSGKFTLLLVGPATRASMSDDATRILTKKYGMTREELGKHVSSLMAIVHLIVAEEIEEYIKMVEEKSPKDIESFKVKIRFVSRMLEKYPYIKNNYFVYSLCKTNFFAEMKWEAGLKVAHSPGTVPRGTMPSTLPFARVIFETYRGAEHLDETKPFEFEITEKDLAFMLDSLKDLRNTMEELKIKKLA